MTNNPLGPAPVEIVLAVSLLLGLAVAGYLLLAAARGRCEWAPAVVMALVAVLVPVVGPVTAFFVSRGLSRPAGQRAG